MLPDLPADLPAKMCIRDRLLTEIKRHFDLSKVQEFTVEAGRPDSITREKLEVIKKHPVTRISINPQTMNQKTLEIIGRRPVSYTHLAPEDRGSKYDNVFN